jgi:Outer membrane protein beta-barrel domain
LYLGMEVGYANPDGNVLGIDTEVTFVPIELNLKYAIPASPNLVFDLGAGASYNYVQEKVSLSGVSVSSDDWLFGGQVFADVNYTSGIFFIGINGKYQITEDIKGGNYSYNNWRVGGQVGVMF